LLLTCSRRGVGTTHSRDGIFTIFVISLINNSNMNELALKLYDHTLELKSVELNQIQSIKFKAACEKAIVENPNLNFKDLLIPTKFYLDVILEYPNSVL
jgi:hypothetical protein